MQKLIVLRMEHPALQSSAPVRFLYAQEHAYPFVYIREQEEEKILVLINPSSKDVSCNIEITDNGQILYSNHGTAFCENGTWNVPAESATFIRL